jgi:hypothetical protein
MIPSDCDEQLDNFTWDSVAIEVAIETRKVLRKIVETASIRRIKIECDSRVTAQEIDAETTRILTTIRGVEGELRSRDPQKEALQISQTSRLVRVGGIYRIRFQNVF